MNRRSFFSSIALAPLSALIPEVRSKIPIGHVMCDLSMTAAQWAILVGQENDFGKAQILRVSPALQFIATELLESEKFPYSPRRETTANPLYHLMSRRVENSFPNSYWQIEFEHGIVYSEGV